jgi:hypothetical protein
MKNHIIVLILINLQMLNSMNSDTQDIQSTRMEPSYTIQNNMINDLQERNKLCNGINIGIGVFGIGCGVSGVVGGILKDKILSFTGAAGSTLASILFITTNCMQCCQNYGNQDNDTYGDL